MSYNPIELTDADYQEKMEGVNGLLLFYKKICPHCKALKKVLEKFAAVLPDEKIMLMDSEENPGGMTGLDISRVPTLVIVKNGEAKVKKAGLMNVNAMLSLYRNA